MTPASDGSRAIATRVGSRATVPSFSTRFTLSCPSFAKSPPGRSAPTMWTRAKPRPSMLSAGRPKVAHRGLGSKSLTRRSSAKGARSTGPRSMWPTPATLPPASRPSSFASDTIERSAASSIWSSSIGHSGMRSFSNAIFPDSQRGPVVGSPGAVASP